MPAPAPAPSPRHPKAGAERLHGAIARNLGVAIVSGVHQPGDILGNEIELSEQLAVSRSAYREAIRILSAKGLVESKPRTGTRVLTMDRWNLLDSDVLSWFFASEPSPVIVNGLFELRMIIEPAAAALAAVRRSDDELDRMRTALEIMDRKTLKTEAGQSADRDFHQAVLTATGNPALVSLASTIGASVRWTTLYKQRKRRLPPDPMPEHWAVFEAIAASDPEGARAAMQALVAHALEQIAGPSGSKSARSVAVARALR